VTTSLRATSLLVAATIFDTADLMAQHNAARVNQRDARYSRTNDAHREIDRIIRFDA
jgi:hypothetical protein